MNAESTESPMLVKAHAPWAGCKRRLATRIAALLGPHDAYWEPFAGGAAVFYAKPPCRIEVLNDLHGDVTNLVRIIADRRLGPQLYRRLRRTMFYQALYIEAEERLKTETDPLERAYLYFIKIWMSWGGVAGTGRAARRMSLRYTNNGGHQATRFRSAVLSIPAWRRRLRNATILSMDAFELFPKIEDAPGTVIYCDPPYLIHSVDYQHDFRPLDHVRLAQALHRFRRARVVISYYDHPALADLYPGWTMERIEVTKTLVQMGKRGGDHRQRAVEVLLVNPPRAVAGRMSLFEPQGAFDDWTTG